MSRIFLLLLLCTVAFASSALIPNGLLPLIDGRIVGGLETIIEEFPWQVSMKHFGSHHCGGSLLNSKTVLSAAHCVVYKSPKDISIVAGTPHRNSGGIKRPVESVISHPQFSIATLDSDYAILLVAKEFELGDTIAPIALPDVNEEFADNSVAIVSGWGSTSEAGEGAKLLQYVKVLLVNRDICNKQYRYAITKYMICAGQEEGQDACQGDSGGPLVSNNKLIGVVSWGRGCGRKSFPGVYSKVSAVRPWIDNIISNM